MNVGPEVTPGAVRSRRYPIRCNECREKAVRPAVVRHALKKNHEGRTYDLVIEDLPVGKCGHCGAISFTDEASDRVDAALREQLGLLSPGEIAMHLRSLGLSQGEAAESMGVAAETMSRWLGGAMIQSRAMDNLMRVYFTVPQARTVVSKQVGSSGIVQSS